jgi:hypothetical protein
MSFAEYAAHGWKLVPFPTGRKGPDWSGWSLKENCVTDPATASGCESIGLAHAYSGTCSIDIDDVNAAAAWLADRGIDLMELLDAPDVVRIDSGRPGRAKLLYKVPHPLTTMQPEGSGLELRCASRKGTTMQDVLPPSIHPDTGEPYQWIGDWRHLPNIPGKLLAVWETLVAPAPVTSPSGGANTDELQALLRSQDPDQGYDAWLRVGMALHHATEGGDEGLELWDEWSSGGEKYRDRRDLASHWYSFDLNGDGLVTADYLRRNAVASPEDFDAIEDTPEERAEKEERFKLVSIAEYAERPPPEWIIRDVLPQTEMVMMYGEPGCGKSFLALDLAAAIAEGRQWRDMDVRQGAVVWIAAEAAGSVRNRARAYAKGYDTTLDNLPLWIIGDTPDLSSVEHVKALAAGIKPVAPRLIVIDTLAAASGGANENSGEDMSVIMAACRALNKITGATILLIHHSGKDKSRGARGWSGIKAAVQTEFEIGLNGDGERELRIAKQRDAEAGMRMTFRLTAVDVGDDQTSCYVRHLDAAFDPATDEVDLARLVVASVPFAGHGRYGGVRATSLLALDAEREDDEIDEIEEVDRAIAGAIERRELIAENGTLSLPQSAGSEFDA